MRVNDAVLEKSLGSGQDIPVLNPVYGGQMGYHANVGIVGPDGKYSDEWVNNQDYVKRSIIPIVLSEPAGFKLFPDSDKMISALKAIMELHPLSITGFNSSLTVEVDSAAIGGSGMEMAQPIDVKRANSTPSFTWREKANKSFMRFWDTYIRYLIADPDIKAPLIAKLNNFRLDGIYTPDFWTFTMIFIETDITQKRVLDAWLTTNMFPTAGVPREGGRDIRQAGETVEFSIEFPGITMNNTNVITLAQKILNSLTILSKIPDVNMTLPSDGISANISAAKTGFNNNNGR